MKKLFLTTFVLIGLIFSSQAQTENQKIPSVNINNLDGKVFNTSEISNNGKPVIICFWATWCNPCKNQLIDIAENYEGWQKELGIKLIAISIDDQRSAPKVKPFVDFNGWEFEVYIDENSDFKRAMKVNNIPHIFVVDGDGNIAWQEGNNPDIITNLYNALKEAKK